MQENVVVMAAYIGRADDAALVVINGVQRLLPFAHISKEDAAALQRLPRGYSVNIEIPKAVAEQKFLMSFEG